MSTKNSCMDDEVSVLPGFRFHPTDGELVGFYLRRKVEKKPIRIELIKQIDIYKYDPWDLPKTNSAGEKEGYFFCQRGRKYRNSVRPNRVTGSGFWKATGIDRPVYSTGGEGNECIGLKKTLVYYRGSAGKGTKTDWMMHEFRLPTNSNNTNIAQEAEVWTLCRIFKRIASNKKYTPDWREISTKTISKKCSVELNNREDNYLSFSPSNNIHDHDERKPVLNHIKERNQLSLIAQQPPSMASSSSFTNMDANGFFTYANWDELRPVVEFAINPFLL